MKWLYRIALIMAGCYFESAARNATQLALYWLQKPDVLQGFLPYIVPVFFGYVYALEVRGHWSENRLKNDIMAYMGSTVLIGYPLFVSTTFWLAGLKVDPNTSVIRTISTVVLVANLAIAILVWRRGVLDGRPFSLPWGKETGVDQGEDEDDADEVAGADESDDGDGSDDGDCVDEGGEGADAQDQGKCQSEGPGAPEIAGEPSRIDGEPVVDDSGVTEESAAADTEKKPQ